MIGVASIPDFNAASVPRSDRPSKNLDNSGKALTQSSNSRSTMAVNQNGKRTPANLPEPISGGLFHHLSNSVERI
ncbi:hypothetical protein [Burkholderia sp. USMB20]|uniref:hypothetical protein n=1 Tax=Burkholderia sp. USMB20 TaxID=1571773 RepID=UPI00187D371D|nr:hypothetical protein [Burkholderia sp. USMB20]